MRDVLLQASSGANDPRVLIADASEERRHLLMQYVAIEWPNAAITELEASVHALACEGAPLAGCDLVLVGLSEQDASDTGWLDAIRARANAPVVVALIDGSQAATQAILQRGVYCQGQHNMTTADMRKMLRAALRERLSGSGAPDNTTIIDTGVLKGGAATHPIQRPSLKRVQIRGYQLLRKLGRGGMSEVYLAQNAATHQLCALKVLPGEGVSASVLDLFIEECSVVSGLDSPYVVKIFEHGVTDECLFVAMEYIQGGDLRERVALGVSVGEATRILQQLAHALDVIHRAGIVHGDIKPQNIMFRDAHSLVLVDFGVSRVVETTTVLR
ncbi:MAG: serine/threonine-protein kinase, partial [Burkholderiaceae bacterium]